MNQTALYDIQKKNNAKFVDFHGWELPVQFSGIIAEHNHTRNSAGLFDVSHMGEIFIESSEYNTGAAEKYLSRIITNDIINIPAGKAVYTVMLNYNGGIIDDLIAYKFSADKFLLIVNASNIEKNFNWMTDIQSAENYSSVRISNVSGAYSLIALQGPKSREIMATVNDSHELLNLKRFNFLETRLNNLPCIVAATGYTGEAGYEILIENSYAPDIYSMLLKNENVKPAALGCRDTLRLEAGLLLYGNDLNEQINPLEANLGWVLKGKGYIGENAVIQLRKSQLFRKLVGIEMIEKGICRQGCKIIMNSRECGYVTSGAPSPTLGKAIGLGYIKPEYSEIGTELLIDIRGSQKKAVVVKLPFYKS